MFLLLLFPDQPAARRQQSPHRAVRALHQHGPGETLRDPVVLARPARHTHHRHLRHVVPAYRLRLRALLLCA